MSYVRLALDPATPPGVRFFVAEVIENLYFSDVHAMLRLPLPKEGITAGQNLAIAQVLMSVIGGISTTLYEQRGRDGNLFKEVLEKFYPWAEEPGARVSAKAGAPILYDVFRNPLVHAVGLAMDWRGAKRFLATKTYVVKIKRGATQSKTNGHSEPWIEDLERFPDRRPNVGPTLRVTSDSRVLLVEALYWGVRKTIRNLTQDNQRMMQAERFLRPLHLPARSMTPRAKSRARGAT